MILRIGILFIVVLTSFATPFRMRRYDIPNEPSVDDSSTVGSMTTSSTGSPSTPPSPSIPSVTQYAQTSTGPPRPLTNDQVNRSGHPPFGSGRFHPHQSHQYGGDYNPNGPAAQPRQYDSGHYDPNYGNNAAERRYDSGHYDPNYGNNPAERRYDSGHYNGQPNFNNGQTQQTGSHLDPMTMLMMAVPGSPGQDYPIYDTVPNTGFSCANHQSPGLYADVNTKCQAFHVCAIDGKLDSFLCPNGTVFHQQYFTCDWWYNVECNQAPNYYSLNKQAFSGTSPPVPSNPYPAPSGQPQQWAPSPLEQGIRSPDQRPQPQTPQSPVNNWPTTYTSIGRGIIGNDNEPGAPWNSDQRPPVSPPYPVGQRPAVTNQQGAPNPEQTRPSQTSDTDNRPNYNNQSPYPNVPQYGQPSSPSMTNPQITSNVSSNGPRQRPYPNPYQPIDQTQSPSLIEPIGEASTGQQPSSQPGQKLPIPSSYGPPPYSHQNPNIPHGHRPHYPNVPENSPNFPNQQGQAGNIDPKPNQRPNGPIPIEPPYPNPYGQQPPMDDDSNDQYPPYPTQTGRRVNPYNPDFNPYGEQPPYPNVPLDPSTDNRRTQPPVNDQPSSQPSTEVQDKTPICTTVPTLDVREKTAPSSPPSETTDTEIETSSMETLTSTTSTTSTSSMFETSSGATTSDIDENTSSNTPDIDQNSSPKSPDNDQNSSSIPPDFGQNSSSNQPDIDQNSSSNPPDFGQNSSSNPPDIDQNSSTTSPDIIQNTSTNTSSDQNPLNNEIGGDSSSDRPTVSTTSDSSMNSTTVSTGTDESTLSSEMNTEESSTQRLTSSTSV